MDSPSLTLHKRERLCSQKAIEALFGKGNPSMTAYPLRAVYMPVPEARVRILVSVSKRCFKQAVRRNRVKRQIREAYRLNKNLLRPAQGGINLAFLWTSNEILPTATVFHKVQNLLIRINESLQTHTPSL